MDIKKEIYRLISLGIAVFALPASGTDRVQAGVWNDTDGNPINAHGGGILEHDGVYYWYGERKGDRTYRSPGVGWECYRTEAGGVSCYSSRDLKNWKFEGVALKPDTADHTSDIHPTMVIERPKVVYNDKTRKFVMWMHIDNHSYSAARAGVAVSDSPTGPFTYIRSERPNNSESRDMTIFKDDDGKAYHIYSSEGNSTLHISLLSDDYLSQSGSFCRNFPNRFREAPAIFKNDGKYYMVTSGCSGWSPNEAEWAVSTTIMGPWTPMDNPCRGKDADKTFYGQSTFVLPVGNGSDRSFIIMFDKWKKDDLVDSRYIWLPIRFNGDTLTIPWTDTVDLTGSATDFAAE
ncbi:MAG: glycoside hydrolase family 43 protein [Duncaniella sp.]|nr:glycoside hydrolase family 43 protein [Duncaniella sp.]HBI57527.1 glycosyl hydrolase family 43 [Porphyromonadaceae bacterium]